MLASSHGRPTGFLSYPRPVRQARGVERYHAPGASTMWVALPIAEEYALGCATGIALGGNYMPNMSLNGDRNVLALTRPELDQPILDACARYARFAARYERLFAGQRAGSGVGVLFDLTYGPRTGQILGLDRGNINTLLWLLQGAGLPAEVVVNSDLRGGLEGYRALLIDDQAMLSPAEMERATRVRGGRGTLVLSALEIASASSRATPARPIAEFLPGLSDALRAQVSALDLELDGYEADGARIKVATEGAASLRFEGEPGPWQITVSYLDESDGQSTFELRVGGEVIDRWVADADDDEWHTRTAPKAELRPGDTVTVHGQAGGGEYARLQWIALRSRASEAPFVEVALGAGRVLQFAGPLEGLENEERTAAMEALRTAAPLTGTWPDTVLVNLLRQPQGGVLSAHIVNHDFAYDEQYADRDPPHARDNPARGRPELWVARLIAPDAQPVDLSIVDGTVTVPPGLDLRNRAVGAGCGDAGRIHSAPGAAPRLFRYRRHPLPPRSASILRR